MAGRLKRAFGYQDNAMGLPVASVEAAIPFYETVLGFRVIARVDEPHAAAVLARDEVRIGLTENGGDPTQDGCAFHVEDLEALFAEFKANGLQKDIAEFDLETHDEARWKVFYVVAPDGLCYWFGERQDDAA
jgi:catechol 2,3-dioxygenase-like lactoylglutathione lyase family enzyme